MPEIKENEVLVRIAGSSVNPVDTGSRKRLLKSFVRLKLPAVLGVEVAGEVVNAVCHGWVRTDMGGKRASHSIEEGAETPVWLATEAPQELTGKFFRDKKLIPW